MGCEAVSAINSYSLYQFTWREAPEYLKMFDITVKWATTSSSLGEFAKLWNISISFISVCPLYYGRTRLPVDGFSRNLMLQHFFQNLSRKFKLHKNPTRITGTLHEYKYIFLSYITRFFLGGEIFQTEVVRIRESK